MADDNEPLGSLPVEITGDFSELQDALNEAASAAQDGSDQIVSALQGIIEASGLAGGDLAIFQSVLEADQQAGIELAQSLQDLSESAASVGEVVAGAAASALEQLATAEQSAGQGASQATTEIEQLATATESASEAAEKGESAWGEFGETLLEFGGIALTAEGLKELATEALETYGNVEKATIALTALTGSAGQATEMLEGLKTMALADALSFPQLVQAQQRMTAFGISSEVSSQALQAAADAAAATGKSFDQVTNSITRMGLSGTLATRQLATLGLSLSAVAEALNTTDDAAKEAFQALDVSERIEVIDTALQKYQGVAESVAQGVLGQFQNLKTQTEFVFESIGEAIAPAAEAFMSFAADVVLPETQNIANAFKDWSTTITDLVGTLSAAGTEIVNTGVNAAGLGQSVDQTGAIIKQVAQDSFTDSFVPGLRLATLGIQELNLGLQALTGITPGADSMLQQMTQHLNQMASAAQMGGDAFKSAFALSVAQATGSLDNLSSGAQSVIDHIAKLNQDISDGKTVLAELKTASDGSAESLQAIAAQSASVEKAQKTLATALGDTAKATKSAGDSLTDLATADANAQSKFDNANTSWANFMTALNNGSTTIDGLTTSANNANIAWNNLAAAYQKATGAVLQWNEASGNTAGIVQGQVNSFTNLQNAVAQTGAALKVQQDAYNAAVVAGTATDEQLQQLQIAYLANQKAIAAMASATNTAGVSMDQLTGKSQDYVTIIVNGVPHVADFTNAQLKAAEQSDMTTNAIGGTGTAVQDLWNKYAAGVAATQGITTGVRNLTQAQTDAATAAKNLATQQQNANTAWANGQLVVQDFNGKMQTVNTAFQGGVINVNTYAAQVTDLTKAMSNAEGPTNEETDALIAQAHAADDAAQAVENLNSATSKSGKGGSGGSGNSLESLLSGEISVGQDPALGGAIGGGGLGQAQMDQMAQELANVSGQIVTTMDGSFIPAAQQAATLLAAQALYTSQSNTATQANTTATTANTTATTASTSATAAATTSLQASQAAYNTATAQYVTDLNAAGTATNTLSTDIANVNTAAASLASQQALAAQSQAALTAATEKYDADLASGSATAQQLSTDLVNVGNAATALSTATGDSTNAIVDNTSAVQDATSATTDATTATTDATTAVSDLGTAATNATTGAETLKQAEAGAAQTIDEGTDAYGVMTTAIQDASNGIWNFATSLNGLVLSITAATEKLNEPTTIASTVPQDLTPYQQAEQQLKTDLAADTADPNAANLAAVRADQATLQAAELALAGTTESLGNLTNVAQTATVALTAVQQAQQQLNDDLAAYATSATAAGLATIRTDQASLQSAELAASPATGMVPGAGSWQYTNPNPGLMEGYAPNDGAGTGVTLNITVSGNFAASDSSIQMLANKVASAATTQLRTLGGLKN